MKKGERSFKINVFSGWMISYLAVLLIPLVLFFVFISVNTHLLTQQVTSYNRNAAALVSSVFDSVFQDINSFCDELLTDDDIEKLYSYQSTDSLTYYSSVQTMARLRGARYTISEALIFCPDLDSYVSSTRWGNIDNIYSLGEIRLDGWTVQDYQRVFSENYNSITLFDSSYELPSGKIQHKVLIVRPLSYAGLGIRNRYYLAALIDMDSLFSQTDSFNQYSNVLIYRSSTGNLLYSFNKDHSFPTVQSLDFAGKDVTVSTLKGRFSGLTYAVTSDNMVYFKAVRVQTTLAIVYFVAAIVLGFALITIKTKKDWKRLNLAIEKTGTSAENLRGKDQYVPFISSVDILKKEKEGLSNLINTQTEEMKNTMIERLLFSNADSMVTEDSLRLCGIELISQLFMVLLTDTDDIDKAEKEITETFDKTGINIYPFTSESGAAFLLNLSDSDEEQSCYNLVSDTIKTTNYASCSVASDLAKGIASIGNAYLDAINTLGYVKRKPVEAFVFHSDIVEVTRHINFS